MEFQSPLSIISSTILCFFLFMLLKEKVSELANGITCRATIGKRCKYQDELIKMVEDIAHLVSSFFMADLLQKVRRKLDRIFDHIMQEHREKLDNKKEGTAVDAEEEDLLDVILRINDSNSLEFPISSNNMQGVILDMFTAGTDTSSAILECAMSELVKHPNAMEKAQAEVRQALKGKENINEVDIQGLKYLKLVIKETLRLHAPVPLLLPRECRKECENVKTKVMVNAWAIGRDPEYWVDAESFVPERFKNNLINYIGTNFEHIPFGAGRRMCAGVSFGIATTELPLAQLLYNFNWKLPNEMKPEDLEMDESSGATTKRRNHLYLIPNSHTPNMTQVEQSIMQK